MNEKILKKISSFSLITLVETSVSWDVLDMSKFKIYLVFCFVYFWKWKMNCASFFAVNMIGWFLNFKMIFIIGSVKFSELKLLLVYSEILKSLQYSRKKSSKTEQHHCLPKWFYFIFFLPRFSFMDNHDLQDSRGKGKLLF